MKRINTKLLLLCLSLLCALSVQSQTKWTLGSGTEEDPYQISSIENLKYLAQEVNAGTTFDSVFFLQTDDLVDNEKVFNGVSRNLVGKEYHKKPSINVSIPWKQNN